MRSIPFSATGRDWRICVRPRYDGLFVASHRLKSQFAELSGPFVEKLSWKRTVVVIASPLHRILTQDLHFGSLRSQHYTPGSPVLLNIIFPAGSLKGDVKKNYRSLGRRFSCPD